MPAERVPRRIDRLLDEAEEAANSRAMRPLAIGQAHSSRSFGFAQKATGGVEVMAAHAERSLEIEEIKRDIVRVINNYIG